MAFVGVDLHKNSFTACRLEAAGNPHHPPKLPAKLKIILIQQQAFAPHGGNSGVQRLGIFFDTLRNEWVFEDFPNFIIAGENQKRLDHRHRRMRETR